MNPIRLSYWPGNAPSQQVEQASQSGLLPQVLPPPVEDELDDEELAEDVLDDDVVALEEDAVDDEDEPPAPAPPPPPTPLEASDPPPPLVALFDVVGIGPFQVDSSSSSMLDVGLVELQAERRPTQRKESRRERVFIRAKTQSIAEESRRKRTRPRRRSHPQSRSSTLGAAAGGSAATLAAMQRVAIFGATSAIAAEFAVLHASRGAHLHLIGRSPSKLDEVARRCAATRVTTQVADFGDLQGNEAIVAEAIRRLGEIDTALIAHGLLGDQQASERSFAFAEETLRVNFTSVVSLLIPLANQLERQGRGRLGVITSVAGDRGRPRNYTYGAAKGALNIYLQGLRTRLYPAKVSVTTLKLGPVDTPMTESHRKHALFGKPDRVAHDMARAIDRGAAEAYVPSFWGAIMPVVKSTPERLFQRLPFLSGR